MLPEFEIPLNVCGLPTIRNRGALAWSSNGLAAVGSGTDILIVDTETLSPVQVIGTEHKSSINRVVWNPYARQITEGKQSKYHADLISSDTLNNICIWDVEKAQMLSTFNHPEGKQLLDLKWCNGPDAWKRNKLYLLYAGNLLVIYDVLNHHQLQGLQLTEPQGVDLTSFDIDPFSAGMSTSLALLGEGFISMATIDPHKNEKITVATNIVLKVGANPPNGSPLAQPTPNYSDLAAPATQGLSSIGKRSSSSSSSIRKLVSDIIVGPENPMNQVIVRFGTLEYLHSMKDHLIVWTNRDIYLINTYFCVVLNVFSLERAVSNIITLIPCRRRPCFFTLHENGTVYLRKYTINNLSHSHNMTLTLDQLCVSENPRLSSKKSEVLGGALEPSKNEKKLIIYLSDGRFISYSICFANSKRSVSQRMGKPSKLLPTPVTPGPACDLMALGRLQSHEAQAGSVSENNSASPESILAYVKGLLESPEVNTETGQCNLKIKLKRATVSSGQLSCLKLLKPGVLVGGTTAGYALIIRCGGGNFAMNANAAKIPKLIKKFAVHSNSPVSGVEVVSETEILTWTNLSFSANPKCELCLTEITCGATKILKQDEPSHIGAIRVSPLGQYFIIVYKNGAAPAELWDLPRRQLIKVLPSKMPPITCVQWREPIEGSKEETFFMTDLGTFLFTLRVDGNRFSNATCATLDTGNMGGIPVALFTRGNLVYRADSSGTLVKYNTDKKAASFGVSLGRGPLFKILEFGDYFVAQFSDQLELWDLNTIQKLRQLHSNKLKSTDIALVNNDLLAVLVKNSGGLKFLPLNTASASAGDWYPTIRREIGLVNEYPHFWTNREKFRYILDFLQDSTKKTSELYSLACKLNFEPDEIKLWSILDSVASASEKGDAASCVDPDLFSNGKVYKEILVRIAQCVWLVDPKKREDVARTLILAGENEKSAEILLDTEPSDAAHYIANGLKAAISVGCNSIPEATKAVLKIIATNLIASGKNEDGLELLCMLYKHSEACKYIESTNDWGKALLLCKTTLSDPPANVQGNETISRYAQYLNNSRYVLKAASLFIYIHKFDRAVEVLFGAKRTHLAYLLLTICEANSLHVPVSDQIKLAIKLGFGRFLFDIGLRREAISFCESLGPQGAGVKAELEILSS